MERITSLKNPKIQQVIKLREKSRERKSERRFIIEGTRELRLAVAYGYQAEIYCTTLFKPEVIAELKRHSKNLTWIEISEKVYSKIALRDSTEGVLAIAKMHEHHLDAIRLNKNPVVLVVESVEKPGNLGAILRTTAAAEIEAVIVCDPLADIYNPNLIRASLGGVFTQQIAVCSSSEAIGWLRLNGIKIYAATLLANAKPHYQANFTEPCAIVVGSEANGLSRLWLDNHDENIVIPMYGSVDSLNVSVAAAVLVFEAVRQRMSP